MVGNLHRNLMETMELLTSLKSFVKKIGLLLV
jgi:hypothetical protein